MNQITELIHVLILSLGVLCLNDALFVLFVLIIPKRGLFSLAMAQISLNTAERN